MKASVPESNVFTFFDEMQAGFKPFYETGLVL